MPKYYSIAMERDGTLEGAAEEVMKGLHGKLHNEHQERSRAEFWRCQRQLAMAVLARVEAEQMRTFIQSPGGTRAGIAPHPAEYVYGMAPRTDATDKGLANRNAREQYIIMRAHARALEIELIKATQNAERQDRSEAEYPARSGSATIDP